MLEYIVPYKNTVVININGDVCLYQLKIEVIALVLK